jgi:RNA polymerase sigma-70 factor (ECF subfamily)
LGSSGNYRCGPSTTFEEAGIATDAEIIRASQADPRLFAAIFDRHFDAIYRYLRRRVGESLADDLAAETFTTAFAVRGKYDLRREDARPWLYGIASNLLRHHYRREERQLRAYARTGVDPVQADLDEVLDRVDAATAGPRLARALASLDRRDRDVLLLYAWADLSYQDIADALGIPPGTVRSRLHRARRIVRELLGDIGQYLDRDGCPAQKVEVLDERA